MIKQIALKSLILCSLIGLALGFFYNIGLGIATAITSLFLIINMLGIYTLWTVIIYKKSIAQGLAIIILKYPVLAYSAAIIISEPWFNKLGLATGFLAFLLSVVVFSLRR